MRRFSLIIERMRVTAGGRIVAECLGPLSAVHAVGPFYLALAKDGPSLADQYLRSVLVPQQPGADRLVAELPPALAHLQPGDEIDLVGPCGRGVTLPDRARNVLLIASDAAPPRHRAGVTAGSLFLTSIANLALSRGCSATLFCERPLPLDDWPPEIEARFGAMDPDTLAWADMLYADLTPSGLRELRERLAASGPGGLGDWAFALRLPAVPCGVGACGACAVTTRTGWKLACVEGPLFDLFDLEI